MRYLDHDKTITHNVRACMHHHRGKVARVKRYDDARRESRRGVSLRTLHGVRSARTSTEENRFTATVLAAIRSSSYTARRRFPRLNIPCSAYSRHTLELAANSKYEPTRWKNAARECVRISRTMSCGAVLARACCACPSLPPLNRCDAARCADFNAAL